MSSPGGPHTGRPPVFARRGMIATPHYLASATGLDVLRRGGSAVDALIAANAVLAVVYPHWCGLGGDGFWLIYDPRDGRVRGLNASGPAARLATRDFYRERGHRAIPGHGGAAALTVPGAVDGWGEAHGRHGRLAWEELFADAIRLAGDGVAVSRSLAYWLAWRRDEILRHPPGRIFLPEGRVPRPGEPFALPRLAASLELLAREGPRALYQGELAERLCAGLEGSPLRPEDLARYRAEWVEPISITYRGYTAWTTPPNTQGIAALQILKLIEGFEVAAWGDGTAAYFHHLAEAVKLALADRDAWVADPRFVDLPVDGLLDERYLRARRTLIDPEVARDIDAIPPGIPHPGGAGDPRPADGRPHLACGTMGGNGQPQTQAALVTRLVDFGYNVQQAIEAPRWVVGQTLGQREKQLYLEGRVPDPVVRELVRRGHDVRMVLHWQEDMGHAQAIRIHGDSGFLEGGADPRGDGMALGY